MGNGLLDPSLISFVFAPLLATMTVGLSCVWRQLRNSPTELDAPARLLACAIRTMPNARHEWGVAMLAELGHIHERTARWRFALGSTRVALFPSWGCRSLQLAKDNPQPYCGIRAVTLPPLGLPSIYFSAILLDAFGGSPLTQTANWSHPDLVMAMVKVLLGITVFCLAAGLPLGLAGCWRRERWPNLSFAGIVSSLCIIGYSLSVMHLVAGGGPNAD